MEKTNLHINFQDIKRRDSEMGSASTEHSSECAKSIIPRWELFTNSSSLAPSHRIISHFSLLKDAWFFCVSFSSVKHHFWGCDQVQQLLLLLQVGLIGGQICNATERERREEKRKGRPRAKGLWGVTRVSATRGFANQLFLWWRGSVLSYVGAIFSLASYRATFRFRNIWFKSFMGQKKLLLMRANWPNREGNILAWISS